MNEDLKKLLERKLEKYKQSCESTISYFVKKIEERKKFLENIDNYGFEDDTHLSEELQELNGKIVKVVYVNSRCEKKEKTKTSYGHFSYKQGVGDMIDVVGKNTIVGKSLISLSDQIVTIMAEAVDGKPRKIVFNNKYYNHADASNECPSELYQYGKLFGKKRALDIAKKQLKEYNDSLNIILSSGKDFEASIKEMEDLIAHGERLIDPSKKKEWERTVAMRTIDIHGGVDVALAIQALEMFNEGCSIAKVKKFVDSRKTMEFAGEEREVDEGTKQMAIDIFSRFRVKSPIQK